MSYCSLLLEQIQQTRHTQKCRPSKNIERCGGLVNTQRPFFTVTLKIEQEIRSHGKENKSNEENEKIDVIEEEIAVD